MRRFPRAAQIIFVASVGLIAAICAVVGVAAYRNERKARECFREFASLELGQATFADAGKMTDLYGGFPHIDQLYNRCDADECLYVFSFRNLWLSRLGLAPNCELTMDLVVERGRVVEREYMYSSEKPGAEAATFVSERLPKLGRDDFKVDIQVDIANKPKRVLIDMTTAASPAEKDEAYSIDPSCLAKLGGCENRAPVLAKVPGI